MLLNLFYSLIGYFLGMFISTIGFSQIFCCLFCAIPVTARMRRNKEPAEYGKIYAKICLCLIFWTFIAYIVFFLMEHFAPAFMKSCALVSTCFFSFLALSKCGMNSNNLQEYVIAYGRYYMNISDENFDIEKVKHTRYCKYCGSIIDDDKKCTGCGKQYFRFPHLRNLKFSHIMCISLILLLSYFCYSEAITIISMSNEYNNLYTSYSEMETKFNDLCEKNADKNKKYEILRVDYHNLEIKYDHEKNESKKLIQYKNTALFWDEYGAITLANDNKYHTFSCSKVQNSDTQYLCTIWDAKDMGYTPCPDCH